MALVKFQTAVCTCAKSRILCYIIAAVLGDFDFIFWAWKFRDLAAFRQFVTTFTLHVRRNGASGEICDTGIWFLDASFVRECDISAIWGRFQSILSLCMLKVCHICTSGLF